MEEICGAALRADMPVTSVIAASVIAIA